MGMNFTVSEALTFASSGFTSSIIDTRDAFDISLSFNTSAGTSNNMSIQVSNWTGSTTLHGTPPEQQWSTFTTFLPSAATDVHPVIGARYMRIVKSTHTTPTFTITYNKHVR